MENSKFLIEFIQMYKSLPCLWKIKSKEYTSRILKDAAYERLIIKLKEKFPDANREMAVKKINALRTNYRREFKKIKESVKSGAGADGEYKPSLWYYGHLAFLEDQDDIAEARNTIEVANTCEDSEPQRKKTKVNDEDNFSCNTLPSKQRNDSLAQSWSEQYKELDTDQKKMARKMISDILFHGSMGKLSMSHTTKLESILNSPSLSNCLIPQNYPAPQFHSISLPINQTPSSSNASGMSTPPLSQSDIQNYMHNFPIIHNYYLDKQELR